MLDMSTQGHSNMSPCGSKMPEPHLLLLTQGTKFPAGDVQGSSSWKEAVGAEFYSTFKFKILGLTVL